MEREEIEKYWDEMTKGKNEASIRIAQAIQPLNKVTMPSRIQVLRGYLRELEEKFPDAARRATEMEKYSDVQIIAVTKMED